MAKFLTTIDIAAQLQKLIIEADEKLYLVSPYLQISKDFQELLISREKKKKETIIIYGKNELTPDQLKFLTSLRYLYLKFYEKLHAKCYINDTKLIITSMNFYEYSMINNKEMGVIYDTSDKADLDIYNDALKYVELIDDNSDDKPFELNIKYDTSNSKKNNNIQIAEKAEISAVPELESYKLPKDYSGSKLLTTKEISQKSKMSSQKINSWFVDNKLMYKKEDDWFATKRGNELGAQQKEGAYGKFIVWPEDIVKSILDDNFPN